MLDGLLDRIGDLGPLALAALGLLLAFAETAIALDLLVPGEVGMVLVGAAAASAGLPVPVAVGAAAVGAFAGDATSYLVGRRWGRRAVERFGPIRRRLVPVLDAADAHVARHGGRSVFLGRFVGALRAVVPLVAGTVGMPWRTFAAWNAAASMAWSTLAVGGGAVLGRPAARALDRVESVVGVLLLVGVGAALVVRRRRRARQAPG